MAAQETRKNPVRHGLTVTLSPIALAGSLGVLCAGFILVFSLGVMLGRGHDIESKIPELQALAPHKGDSAPPVVIDGGQAQPGQVVAVFEGSPSGEPVRTEVLGQEDLGYRENLKNPTPSRRPQGEENGPGSKPAADPGKSAAKPESGPARGGAPGLQPLDRPIGADKAAPDNKRYKYVYQVASSRDQAASEALVAKLRAAGLTARLETSESNGVVWHRTIVDFSGSTAEAEALRERMKGLGIQDPFLKSRK